MLGRGRHFLIDAVRRRPKADAVWRVHMGALQASEWVLRAILSEAGGEIDRDPQDRRNEARARALIARHLIERTCTEVLDRFGRATGPRLLAFDGEIARRYSELTLYIRQCHAEADLEQIPTADVNKVDAGTHLMIEASQSLTITAIRHHESLTRAQTSGTDGRWSILSNPSDCQQNPSSVSDEPLQIPRAQGGTPGSVC